MSLRIFVPADTTAAALGADAVAAAVVANIALVNNRDVMSGVKAEPWRNAVLVLGLLASLVLAVHKAPGYVQLLFG